ncbi:uncharacterized protein LOC122063328 isoform X2 [Macadamia integrifolia]|uniref:uncharacterized protein LOC122063328 isoform X2 n=1 Tax=Macadamia integrifolia TaxID=60698 RepID=UPI001C4F4C94|nr:uncharacterized protein LOC122063328 isoform X2 [Macadamia integrifolia]
MPAGVEMTESGRVAAVALDFPVVDLRVGFSSSSPPKLPRRLRQRLLQSKSPSTAEEIEAKLREADLRRQQFHEWLSSKARPKPRSSSGSSSQDEDLGQRLEAKLYAAKEKRMSILAKAQMRLARLDELRKAVKTGVEMRFEKEREELGTKVESRVQQAEANRLLLLKAYKQRRALAKERIAQSLSWRMVQKSKSKERVRTEISQKRAAAEKKRSGLLEAEKTKARAMVLLARKVAMSVYQEREIERSKLKDQLENRLQKAKRQRAEYLRQRGNLHTPLSTICNKMHKQGDFLSRKLARCWRQFVRLRKTTFALAKSFEAIEINEKSVKLMPFEQLALRIESPATLQTVKALLDRFESRYVISRATAPTSGSSLDNIDHLLKRVSFPSRKGTPGNLSRSRAPKKAAFTGVAQKSVQLSRYPVRVVLCAYMILSHPDAVFNGQGEREIALAHSAGNFIREFEWVIESILDGTTWGAKEESSTTLPKKRTFRSQLAAFDAAWCSYLYCFVVWKLKDARSLEEDLVRAACQLELSMMQTCKITPEGNNGSLTHDMKAIQKQVTEDRRLLRERIQHLSGDAGIEHLESALSETRSRFFEAKDNGSLVASQNARVSSLNLRSASASTGSAGHSSVSISHGSIKLVEGGGSHVVGSLFKNDVSPPTKDDNSRSMDGLSVPPGENSKLENEILVNEIVHEHRHAFAESLNVNDGNKSGVKATIKDTMEKAFWDGVAESMKQDEPNYCWVVELMKEVRDELCEMAPQSWKQEILEAIDLEILSEVLMSGSHDMVYLGKILEYALVTLQKLSAPAMEVEMRTTHKKLLNELGEISQAEDKSNASFVLAMIKGLHFVLEQIQELKREISKGRIRMMEPLIKGPAGLEYLRNAFANRYGSPSDALTSLPLTVQWFSSVKPSGEQEWEEHIDSLSALSTQHTSTSQGLLPSTTLRTGGSVLMPVSRSQVVSLPPTSTTVAECRGEMLDLLVRLGLLKLASGIEGLKLFTIPETLKLNLSRIRAVQAQFQKIVVISTSILVLRQTLISENLGISPSEIDNLASESVEQLFQLLDRVEDVGIAEIIEIISVVPDGGDNIMDAKKVQKRKEVMASLLVKSLQAGNTVFERVSQAVYLATRGVILGGSGSQGRELAHIALRRIGATVQTGRVVEAAEMLIVMATVSSTIHGPWYTHVLDNIN